MSASSSFPAELEKYLENRSYVEDYNPTSADVEILGKLEQLQIGGADFPHLIRWRNHLLSFEEAEKRKFPKSKTSAEEYIKRIAGSKALEGGKAEVSRGVET